MRNSIKGVERILVVKLRAIGDVLLSTVVLPNLREVFPAAQIDFLTERPSREILEGNCSIDNLHIFNVREESGLSLIRRIRAERYQLVIDLFGNPRSALVTLFSGAKHRVGYRFGWRRYCYTNVVEPRGGEVHNLEFNLDALRAIGVPVPHTVITVPVTADSEQAAERYFQEHDLAEKFVVALNPGGGWYTKRWPADRFAALGDRLHEAYGAEILLTWGPGEEELTKTISSHMKYSSWTVPRVGLKGLASILKRCTAVVTNDSGPMHIAAAMGTPILAIFGPTNPQFQGPVTEKSVVARKVDLSCLNCNLTTCPIENPCMQELTVEQVAGAFETLMKRFQLRVY